jgi:hypothetical protein
MAHIEKRGPKRWRARYRGPDGGNAQEPSNGARMPNGSLRTSSTLKKAASMSIRRTVA